MHIPIPVLGLIAAAFIILYIVGHWSRARLWSRANRDYRIALHYIASGGAEPHAQGFAGAIVQGNTTIITQRFSDYANFRAEQIAFEEELDL